ncbi:tetratricopeptide repeat protein [Flavobacterium sp. '19STA2R22 D10 B1']|uniref:tetratricopeptide repeat protein n=1 Tax=Flavobacterium aerium TaxID=3037261 RepID=UPI00278BF109|nr:tetratricopeptide repeat protein [Flavobacterium sp. '19STA2R22 D10 B1']
MATYNKRGYKAPKPNEIDETGLANEADQHSTTAEVFSTLDAGVSRTENWVAKNQKYIFGIVGVVALATAGYLLYGKFVTEPKEEEAANEMFQAQQYFQQAVNGVASDSLYNLSLKGGEGKFGFIDIADKYSGTNAVNLAHYYAGMAYLNINKYKEAIAELDKFHSDDMILNAVAKGAIGDAFSQNNQLDEALDYYEKAAKSNKNDLTTPRYLLKAGQVALSLGKKDKALQYFNDIKNNYDTTPEAASIDALIGMAQ